MLSDRINRSESVLWYLVAKNELMIWPILTDLNGVEVTDSNSHILFQGVDASHHPSN
uniref:Uncharacterized protein n=1 Tax=Anguilla anguilla TaxID=7936 RepID=A0A0E9W471_ANGAN